MGSPGLLISSSQRQVLTVLVASIGSLSIFSSLLIIYRCLTIIKTKDKSSKIVIYLSIAVIGSDAVALGFLGGGSCRAYSVLQTYFILSSVAWSSMLARNIFLVRVQRSNLSQTLTRLNSFADRNPLNIRDIERMRMIALHVIAWGVPLLISIIMAIVSIDTPMSDWCWFNYDGDEGKVAHTTSAAILLLFYLPLLASLLYNTFVLSGLGMKRIEQCFYVDDIDEAVYQQTVNSPLEKQLERLSEKLRGYVVWASFIMFWLCLAEVVNLTQDDTNDSESATKFGIYVFLVTLLRLQGSGNLAIYCRAHCQCFREEESRGAGFSPQVGVEGEGMVVECLEDSPLYSGHSGSYKPPLAGAIEDSPRGFPVGEQGRPSGS